VPDIFLDPIRIFLNVSEQYQNSPTMSLASLKITTHTSAPLGPAVNNKPFLAEVEAFDAFLTRLDREPNRGEMLF
jgi:hypothetical protein